MKRPRYQYKEDAKALLDGKYQKPIIVLLGFYIVNLIIGSALTRTAPKYATTYPFEMIDAGNPALNTILGIVEFAVGAAIIYGIIKLALYIYHKKDIIAEEILLSGFKENYIRNLFLQFLRSLFTFLWSLLFIIPGIVKSYAYSMAFFIVNKEPETDAMLAINKSKEMTMGNKASLFMLDLSYLGWYFIGIFTLGILWLWVIPKHQVARIMYFEEIYQEHQPKKQETKTDIFSE